MESRTSPNGSILSDPMRVDLTRNRYHTSKQKPQRERERERRFWRILEVSRFHEAPNVDHTT